MWWRDLANLCQLNVDKGWFKISYAGIWVMDKISSFVKTVGWVRNL